MAAGQQSEHARPDAPSVPAATVFVTGSLSPADVPALVARVLACVDASGTDLVACDVSGVATPDCATIDALARVQLAVRRIGARICLRNASRDLTDLVALAGLTRVLGDVGTTRPAGRAVRKAGRTSRCRERT